VCVCVCVCVVVGQRKVLLKSGSDVMVTSSCDERRGVEEQRKSKQDKKSRLETRKKKPQRQEKNTFILLKVFVIFTLSFKSLGSVRFFKEMNAYT